MSISLRLLQAAGGSGLNIAAGTTPSPGNYFSPYDANASNRIYDPKGLTFNSNGTKFYMGDGSGVNNSNTVDQYSLATAYDLGSATFDTRFEVTFSGSGISNVVAVKGIRFNNTGSKVFIQVQRSLTPFYKIAEYSLSTNYDLSTISEPPTTVWDYANSNVPEDIWFKPDGTRLFILEGSATNGLTHYNLSTAFDLSTMSASPDGETNWGNSTPNSSGSLAINSDGTKVYIGHSLSSGASGQIVELRMSSAWDASTIVTSSGNPTIYNSTQFDDFERTIRPRGLYISSDDTKMFASTDTRFASGAKNYQDSRLSGYDLSSAGDITTGTIMKPSTDFISIVEETVTGLDKTAVGPKNAGIAFSPDGSSLFTIGKGSSYAKIFKWTLSTPWAVATASYSQNQDLNPQGSSIVEAVAFKSDGTLFVTKAGTTLYRFSMSSAFDVTTATKDKEINLGSGKASNDGMYITPDGTKIFTSTSGSPDYINEFTMSTAWDVSTATETNSVSMAAFTDLTDIQNLTFDTSGRVLIVSSVTNDSSEPKRNLIQFNLSKSFDLDNITSVTQELALQNSASEFGQYITGICLSPDNRYLYTVDGVTESIWRINLKG